MRDLGQTLFHLEPNIKDVPGGLRDSHVAVWLEHLKEPATTRRQPEMFLEAFAFLCAVRVFLHLRHGRDDNTLDWACAGRSGGTWHRSRDWYCESGRIPAWLQRTRLTGCGFTSGMRV